MQYVHKNVGVCSRETIIDIDENHIIQNVEVIGGCDGNLKGVASLLKGLKAEDAISRLQGLTCGYKKTSCPDQIATALTEAIEKWINNFTNSGTLLRCTFFSSIKKWLRKI